MQLATISSFKREYIMTDIENEKIILPLKLMTRSEIMNDLLDFYLLFKNMPIKKDANIALIY